MYSVYPPVVCVVVVMLLCCPSVYLGGGGGGGDGDGGVVGGAGCCCQSRAAEAEEDQTFGSFSPDRVSLCNRSELPRPGSPASMLTTLGDTKNQKFAQPRQRTVGTRQRPIRNLRFMHCELEPVQHISQHNLVLIKKLDGSSCSC